MINISSDLGERATGNIAAVHHDHLKDGEKLYKLSNQRVIEKSIM